MTVVSTIIADAYKESNLIPEGATPSTTQMANALRRLNTLLLSTVGNEVGDELNEINYGGDFTQAELIDQWVPDNTRLIINVTAAFELDLDPYPYEGQRVAIVDVLGNLSTYPSVLNGNGRLIEAFATADLNEDGMNRQWLYRSDIGSWVRINELEEADEMPFPVEYDDYFVTMLAGRLNPRYGQTLSQETVQTLNRTRSQFRSRYRCDNYVAPSDPGLLDPKQARYGQNNFSAGFIRPLG